MTENTFNPHDWTHWALVVLTIAMIAITVWGAVSDVE